jgi:hypothetical protein
MNGKENVQQHAEEPDVPEEICPQCKMPLSEDICCPE